VIETARELGDDTLVRQVLLVVDQQAAGRADGIGHARATREVDRRSGEGAGGSDSVDLASHRREPQTASRPPGATPESQCLRFPAHRGTPTHARTRRPERGGWDGLWGEPVTFGAKVTSSGVSRDGDTPGCEAAGLASRPAVVRPPSGTSGRCRLRPRAASVRICAQELDVATDRRPSEGDHSPPRGGVGCFRRSCAQLGAGVAVVAGHGSKPPCPPATMVGSRPMSATAPARKSGTGAPVCGL
jgi:hypothetical protein